MKKNIVVLYHNDCWDGFAGAYATWRKFKDKADYLPVGHNNPPPLIINKEIYLIDFCYPSAVLKTMIKNNKKLVVIDHHISQESAVKSAPDYVYDLKHSGSVLAWFYFHSHKKTPRLISYIEDMDLWKLRFKETKPAFAYLRTAHFDFKNFDKLVKEFENKNSRKKHLERGRIILKYENRIIDYLVNQARLVDFYGYKVLSVNSPILGSEIGYRLYLLKPPFSIVWFQKKNRINVSLRSNDSIDVSKIAKKFGGGGHKGAAGFSFGLNQKFPWKN